MRRRGEPRPSGDDPYAWIDEVAILLSEASIHGCANASVPVDALRDLVRVARTAREATEGGSVVTLRRALRREGPR